MSGLKSWSAILVLAIWGVLMVVTGGLPAAAPEIVPSTEFSAGRAMKDVAAMAQAPHPTGSVEACKVRDYLTARLRDLGFEVAIQKGVAAEQFPTPSGPLVSGGVVENIIARMPGENPELKAVALMAHYDSVAGSPGAADDAAGDRGGDQAADDNLNGTFFPHLAHSRVC